MPLNRNTVVFFTKLQTRSKFLFSIDGKTFLNNWQTWHSRIKHVRSLEYLTRVFSDEQLNSSKIFELISIQLDIVAMANQTKLFHSLRQLYQTLGIYPSEASQTYRFEWKTIFFVASTGLLFITSFAFFLFEAETVDDYGTSFYTSVSQCTQTSNIFIMIWRMPIIVELLKKFERLTELSKLKISLSQSFNG